MRGRRFLPALFSQQKQHQRPYAPFLWLHVSFLGPVEPEKRDEKPPGTEKELQAAFRPVSADSEYMSAVYRGVHPKY